MERRLLRVMRGSLPAVFILLSVVSCARKDDSLELPVTSVLINRNQAALVRVEYARLYDAPDFGGEILLHARFGDVLDIIDRAPDGSWFYVRTDIGHGWMYSEDAERYASRAQALNARSDLSRGNGGEAQP